MDLDIALTLITVYGVAGYWALHRWVLGGRRFVKG